MTTMLVPNDWTDGGIPAHESYTEWAADGDDPNRSDIPKVVVSTSATAPSPHALLKYAPATGRRQVIAGATGHVTPTRITRPVGDETASEAIIRLLGETADNPHEEEFA